MKGAIATAAIVAVLAVAAGAAATWPSRQSPGADQVQAWLVRAADRDDRAAEAALARWSARGDAGARHAYAALLGHRPDAASRQRLVQVLEQGVAAGDPQAATRLAGLVVRDEPATAANRAKAVGLYAQGAAGGIAEATRMLGTLALNGANGPVDAARGAALLSQAAGQGDAPAMFLLANLLRSGQGVARDEPRALALYQRAADADYAPAIQALAMAWRDGELGLAADPSQSRLMDHEAAEALSHAAATSTSTTAGS